MKALWRKYFSLPSEGYISDRVFMARLTAHICAILLCLACLAYSAYALFASDLYQITPIPSENGEIKTAAEYSHKEGVPL